MDMGTLTQTERQVIAHLSLVKYIEENQRLRQDLHTLWRLARHLGLEDITAVMEYVDRKDRQHEAHQRHTQEDRDA